MRGRLLQLTEDEARYLGMHAAYAAAREDDPRHCDLDAAKSARLKARWLEIRDALCGGSPWEQIEFTPPALTQTPATQREAGK